MRKKKTIIALCILIAITVCTCTGAATLIAKRENTKESERKQVQPKKLIITIPKKKTSGSITFYYDDGSVQHQYKGDINIKNDGVNGEDIEIVVQLPTGPDDYKY